MRYSFRPLVLLSSAAGLLVAADAHPIANTLKGYFGVKELAERTQIRPPLPDLSKKPDVSAWTRSVAQVPEVEATTGERAEAGQVLAGFGRRLEGADR